MKSNFFKSSIILIIGGLITKLLSLIIKIVLVRTIDIETMGLYMLIMPTFMLLINISQFSFPLAISKLIAEDKKNNLNLVLSCLPIIMIINIIIIIGIIKFAPFISINLLHNKNLSLSIQSMALVIPFTTISSICRSYFFGKEKMIPHVVSNVVENITRLVLIIIIGKYLINPKYTLCILIVLNIISELISTIILILFIPKNIIIKKCDLIPNRKYIKDSLRISIPNTSNQLIGSFAYFIEPIIILKYLKLSGLSSNYVTREYGVITGYIIPLILLPSFFTQGISSALLPAISLEYSNNNISNIKRLLKKAIYISLFIGTICIITILLKPKQFLELIYNTNKGINYLKILGPIFILQYIQAPLISYLNAINKSHDLFIITLIGTIIRLSSLIILAKLNLGIYSFIYAIIISIIINTVLLFRKIQKSFI